MDHVTVKRPKGGRSERLFHSSILPLFFILLLLIMWPGQTLLAQSPVAPTATRADVARTEGAIAGGLKWLKEHQVREGALAGSWPANRARPAIASLAGMAFLANSHLPGDKGPYGTNVAAALKYVMGAMAPDGYVGQGDSSGMYIHAISSLFALSCLGMQSDETLEPELAEWCRRSVDVVVRAQLISKAAGQQGGWKYDPYTTDSDISVTCWQLLVLHTARQAGFQIEPSVYRAALGYLSRAYGAVPGAKPDKGNPDYAYFYPDRRIGGKAERSATALVVFIMSLFNAADEQRTRHLLTYLSRDQMLTWSGEKYGGFFYFGSFYMAQGMFQIGGREWDDFGPRMTTLLLDHQNGDGSWPYPSDNVDQGSMRAIGPAYPVAMAVLMLSLDKQYLPMYQRQSRIYDSGATMVLPAETPAEALKTREISIVPIPLPIPIPDQPSGSAGGGSGGVIGNTPTGDEGEEEKMPARPIGSPMFK